MNQEEDKADIALLCTRDMDINKAAPQLKMGQLFSVLKSNLVYFTIPRSEFFTKLTIFSISSLIGTWSTIFCTASCTLKLP